MKNREKAIVIDALRNKYQLSELLVVLDMAKSSYCYQVKSLKRSDKYAEIRVLIKSFFECSKSTYGYRRIRGDLKAMRIRISEKVVRRIMSEEKLRVISIKKRKYNSYKGEITPADYNLLKRNFHAKKPNEKWLTDITEFSIPAGKVYLSPIIDCFDGSPIAWSIGVHPNAELVNTMLKSAIKTLKVTDHPIIHSDRGCHYRWPEWIDLTEKNQLIRSMSQKGCSPDNSACEGFFGRIKNEMFYGRDWHGISLKEFIIILDEYLNWYVTHRRKLTLGCLSPLEYRQNLGLV